MSNLETAFEHLVKDMYDSEKRLLEAMPTMRDAASNAELKKAIDKHIKETGEHIKRLESVAETCGFSVSGETCAATVGLVKEAQKHLEEFKGTPAADAVIVSSLQKNEHYEIANYGTATTWAELLGKKECVIELQATLQEEEECDEALNMMAKKEINKAAMKAK